MRLAEVTSGWMTLRPVERDAFVEGRLQAHWAVQPIAAAARALVEPKPDDSHTSLRWKPDAAGFVGHPTPSDERLSLRLSEWALVAAKVGGDDLDTFSLRDRTLDEALAWAASALGGERLQVPDYDLPEHDLGSGGRFSARNVPALARLERWFGNTARVLEWVRSENADASPVRIWPHHFDAATLITLDPDEADPERARSINVGMSPGDGSSAEPYIYVNPWPRPETAEHPPLEGGGGWHTKGWFGAVLPAATILETERSDEQAARVTRHVSSAIAACRELLG